MVWDQVNPVLCLGVSNGSREDIPALCQLPVGCDLRAAAAAGALMD